jgi:peptidoglycan LD-endopeptidase CwlK
MFEFLNRLTVRPPRDSDAAASPAPKALAAGAGCAESTPCTSLPSSQGQWRSMFGGEPWRFDALGVYTKGPRGGAQPWRTAGPPVTARSILACHGAEIRAAACRHGVAEALILMVIATETGAFGKYGFTGPRTFRWEKHFRVNFTGDPAHDGVRRGDYSAGPMQVMSDTARWINAVSQLDYDGAQLFPVFSVRPSFPPRELGLYDPATNIDVGTAYIAYHRQLTGDDPLLVAAVYNAGALRPGKTSRWRLRSHGDHLDRAARWYGDACAVLAESA